MERRRQYATAPSRPNSGRPGRNDRRRPRRCGPVGIACEQCVFRLRREVLCLLQVRLRLQAFVTQPADESDDNECAYAAADLHAPALPALSCDLLIRQRLRTLRRRGSGETDSPVTSFTPLVPPSWFPLETITRF